MKALIAVISALADSLLEQDEAGRRHAKPIAWFVVAGAVLVIGLAAWSKASAAAAWVGRVDANVEQVKALQGDVKTLERRVDTLEEMKQDVRLIRDGLIRRGLVEAPRATATPGGQP